MTGFRSRRWRHDCVKGGCYIEALPSWDWLIDCFRDGVLPTDIDGMVEVSGNFLFLEQKKKNAEPAPAQLRAFLKLSQHPTVTVLLMRPHENQIETRLLRGGKDGNWLIYSQAELEQKLKAWFDYARENPR